MKKVFCIWLIIVFSFIPQSCCAFSLIPKKSTEVKSMDKVSSTANALAKLLASMSTSCDSFTQKNWAGEDDVSSLVALRICMKNFSELFYWVGRLFESFQSNFNNFQKAEKDAANASSERATEKADKNLEAAKAKLTKVVDIIFGNAFSILIANSKLSADMFMLSIKQQGFSQANINTVRKNFENIRKKSNEMSVEVKGLSDVLRRVRTSLSDIEVEDKKQEKLISDLNTIADVVTLISNYYIDEDINEEATNNLQKLCSLSDDAGESDSKDDKAEADDDAGEEENEESEGDEKDEDEDEEEE